jgi:hypothetical protein
MSVGRQNRLDVHNHVTWAEDCVALCAIFKKEGLLFLQTEQNCHQICTHCNVWRRPCAGELLR